MKQDLKLENIMLASVDPPEAVVIDVGLAELFPVSEADSFRSADPAGTLATMAPVPWRRGGMGRWADGMRRGDVILQRQNLNNRGSTWFNPKHGA